MLKTSGLSGNEIYCLVQKGYTPGNLVVGNSVHSLGFLGSLGSSFQAIVGGELKQVTSLIEEGREAAYQRLLTEAEKQQAVGISAVSSELVFHGNNIEFLSIGSALQSNQAGDQPFFSTSADGQELYAQLDAGYQPLCFAFGNVAYSMGAGRGIVGGLKTLIRGEIKEYSDVFNHTRHLALERICAQAKTNKANAVLGIQTSILPFGGINEMLMIGTAAYNPLLAPSTEVISSDLTNVEMWNLAKLGYQPLKLVLGTSIYSLGLIGSITSTLKSFIRGEINELTTLIYQARENALNLINEEAEALGADMVVGVKTYVYKMDNGLIEFLAIGTAVKKSAQVRTQSEQLPPQAIVTDMVTFFDFARSSRQINLNRGMKPVNNFSFLGSIFVLGIVLIYLFMLWLKH